MSIPLYIFEEHNEALFFWICSLKKGELGLNNILLHFDDHSDLRSPILHETVNGLPDKDLTYIKNFIEAEIKIDTFIIPSIYLNIISDFLWIKNGVTSEADMQMFVRSYNDNGKKFISGKANGTAEDSTMKFFRFIKTDINNLDSSKIDLAKHFVLDIDLDYFSCCEMPYIENEVLIEITKNEYFEYLQQQYHPLNFITSHIKAIEYNGKYFYSLNGIPDKYPSQREVSIDVINKRISEFADKLTKLQIKPDLITVCRSRYSGYTPSHQWEIIEKSLLEVLQSLYMVELHMPEIVMAP